MSKTHIGQVPYDPVRTRFLDQLEVVRRRQTNDLAASSLPSSDACRCVFDDQNGRTGRQTQPGLPQNVAVRVWLPLLNVLGHHKMSWLRKLQNLQPAGHQRSRPGCDDGPGNFGGLEGGEKLTGARDFLCILAVLSRDEAFDVADVYSITQLRSFRDSKCRRMLCY